MSDDLVKRARHNVQADMPHYASVELIEAMADRIEELEGQLQSVLDRETSILRYYDAKLDAAEAKLAKAEVIIRIIASDEWDERLGEAVDLSCEYLADLEGEQP